MGGSRGHVDVSDMLDVLALVGGSATDNVFMTPVERGGSGLVKRACAGVEGEEGDFEVAFFRDDTGKVKEVMLIASDAGMDRVEGDIGGRDPLVSILFFYADWSMVNARDVSEECLKEGRRKGGKKRREKDIWQAQGKNTKKAKKGVPSEEEHSERANT